MSDTDPLTIPLERLVSSLNINTISAYAAAQASVSGFSSLPASASRTFIYTGNKLNLISMPKFLDLGVGKSATAHIIKSASISYKDKGYK